MVIIDHQLITDLIFFFISFHLFPTQGQKKTSKKKFHNQTMNKKPIMIIIGFFPIHSKFFIFKMKKKFSAFKSFSFSSSSLIIDLIQQQQQHHYQDVLFLFRIEISQITILCKLIT